MNKSSYSIVAIATLLIILVNIASGLNIDKSKILLEKLEKYITNRTAKNDITLQDFDAARREQTNWLPKDAIEIYKSDPLVGCLTFLQQALIVREKPDKERFEGTYKFFRDECRSGKIHKTFLITTKLQEAVNMLFIGVKNQKPMTLEPLLDVRNEFDLFLGKFKTLELKESNRDTLLKSMFYLNNDQILVLKYRVFAEMEFAFRYGDPNKLKVAFTNLMNIFGWIVKDGKIEYLYG